MFKLSQERFHLHPVLLLESERVPPGAATAASGRDRRGGQAHRQRSTRAQQEEGGTGRPRKLKSGSRSCSIVQYLGGVQPVTRNFTINLRVSNSHWWYCSNIMINEFEKRSPASYFHEWYNFCHLTEISLISLSFSQ